jgi:predicted esterase
VVDATMVKGACTITATSARCQSLSIVSLQGRSVYWAQPNSAAPSGGRRAVVLYQGSLFGPSLTWNVDVPLGTPFGGYYQVALVDALLDAGFTVIQPAAGVAGVWDTNTQVISYDLSSDAKFIPALLAQIASGAYGPIDSGHLYATGISSGGYMTSRMAVSYAGKFRALAIESASYATCIGPLCNVPATLPSDHPPTLFLHGGADATVPISTARPYYDKLVAQHIETRFIEDPAAGHQWLSSAPKEVTAWFLAH